MVFGLAAAAKHSFFASCHKPDFPWPARLCGRYDLSFDLCARATPLPSVLRSHTIRIRSLHLIRGAAHARTLPGVPTDARQLTLRHPFLVTHLLPLPPNLLLCVAHQSILFSECVFVITLFPALITPSNHSPHTLSVFILSGDADPLSSLQFGATTATSDTIVRGEVSRRRLLLRASGASHACAPMVQAGLVTRLAQVPTSVSIRRIRSLRPSPGPPSVFIPIPVPTFDS
ncbi:hypothetical protein B0H13DRAFT_2343115 [Mycena leptocephala]|nr:hypothetical protein B0H13DRAFT_2343115 [Mycena leptocephala]